MADFIARNVYMIIALVFLVEAFLWGYAGSTLFAGILAAFFGMYIGFHIDEVNDQNWRGE